MLNISADDTLISLNPFIHALFILLKQQWNQTHITYDRINMKYVRGPGNQNIE